jgi:hypothetical protein
MIHAQFNGLLPKSIQQALDVGDGAGSWKSVGQQPVKV